MSTVGIPLKSEKYPDLVALVDEKDSRIVSEYQWYPFKCKSTFYARTKTGGTDILMHRLLLAAPPREMIDHRNHDGLDNRRSNLRRATTTQNCANARKKPAFRSQYKGVEWHKVSGKWQARIRADGKRRSLGYFTFEKDAARAYDQAAREYHGEFACVNFPERGVR